MTRIERPLPTTWPAMSSVKLALLAQQAREQIDDEGVLAAEPIAILGVACRFPGGADTPEKFWELLHEGRDAVVEVPADRWDADAYYDPDSTVPGKMNTRWGGFVDDIDRFDAEAFGISPREASRMDPQQRILLEVAVEALERAGQPADRIAGTSAGVFVGSTMHDYADRQYDRPMEIDAYSVTGSVHCITANRLSYLLDLRGPSFAVDTACSSSLVAVHEACQSLRSRESDLAIAGAVNVVLSPEPSVAMSKWGVMAADGRCKTFDAGADGFVRGEGCGVVVLKRLSDALAADDPVVAVVRGSAVNQDGRSTAMSAPNGLAQQDVIRAALRSGRVLPEQIGLIETHGTGTELGDPIEVEALAAVLGAEGAGAPKVALGAVKTNVGHLEAAAGMAGLIKLVLCLQHGEIPPNLHLSTLNPHISLDGTRMFLPSSPHPWPSGDAPRLAGVSAFGFGGTNAHVVVEEPPQVPPFAPVEAPYVLPVSARTPEGVRAAAGALADHLAAIDDSDHVGSACATAATRRTHHDERLVVGGATGDDLVDRLRRFAAGEPHAGFVQGRREPGRRRVAFVFSGQGTQWWAMGRELLARSTVFRETLERCDELLGGHVGWSLLDELGATEEASRLDETEFAQPALFALQVGLAAVWRSWGIVPDAVAGHSVGEVAAAHVAGALSLDQAIRVIAHRGRMMQAATGNGSMASVALERDGVEAAIAGYGDRLSIAALNAPTATVVSGDTAALGEVNAALTADGVDVRMLPVNYAFHSRQMEGHARDLGLELGDLAPSACRVRFVSTVTGSVADGGDLDGGYWARNVGEPVRFADAIGALAELGCDTFVEVGPHPVLGGAISATLEASERSGVIVPTLRRGRPDLETMHLGLGSLHCCGVPVDWSAVMPGRHRTAALPTVPWQRSRYWVDRGARAAASTMSGGPTSHPLLGRRLRAAAIRGFVYESTLTAADPSFLGDHRIGDLAVVPATAYFELATAAYAAATSRRATGLQGIELLGALALRSDQEPTVVQVHLQADPDVSDPGRMSFSIASLGDDGEWTTHATGHLGAYGTAGSPTPLDLEALADRCPASASGEQFYADVAARGVGYGESFRAVDALRVGQREALATLVSPALVRDEQRAYAFHPALLDAAMHPLALLLPGDDETFLPIALGELRLHAPPRDEMTTHVRLPGDLDGATVDADVTVCAHDGSLIAEMIGLRLVRTDARAVADLARRAGAPGAGDEHVFELDWQPLPTTDAVPPEGPWLIVDDRGGLAPGVEKRLAAGGATCVRVPADVEITPQHAAELVDTSEAREVVYLRGLDIPAPGSGSGDVVGDQKTAISGALAVVQALIGSPARLWIVTCGAQAVGGPPTAPEQATLSGLGATIVAEHPELDCVRVDLDPTSSADAGAAALTAAITASGGEELVAVRGAERLVARLVPTGSDRRPRVGGPTRLASNERGVLDSLHLEPLERRAPGAGEVEIRVAATGLNFRDVLIALDLYPERVDTFGDECSGEIVRVGEGVDHLVPGDRVVSMGSGAFSSHLTTNADLAARLPDDLSFDDAATIPIPFLTAQYALTDLGRMSADDRVLIHAAAGGVGMAAVQLAQLSGAEVFATAGNPEKRATLQALGVRHVFDSRSLDFAADVLAATDGRGVDLVLNSLSGDFIPRSLDVLAPGGRFLEIGKRDIWTADQVAGIRPDVEYSIVFLGDLSLDDPPAIRAMLGELLPCFVDGSLRPLPRTTFDVDEVVDAFRFMAQARHTGKIVVRQHDDGDGAPVRPDVTYLITGGLGGLGLRIAEHLIDRGARHLALVGRSDVDATAAATIAELGDRGAQVSTFRADVGRRSDVSDLLTDIEASMPPLRGIIHAAGVNDDAVLSEQTWASFETALRPKLAGGWYLHDLTRGMELDLFVLFSSAAAVLGAPGQANYAAANAFLDSLGAARGADSGLAHSIGWGPWDDLGMTARLDARDLQRMQRRGIVPLGADAALAVFDRVAFDADVPAYVLAIDLDTAALDDRPVLAALRRSATSPVAPSPSDGLFQQWIDTVPGMRRTTIAAFVVEQARTVLGLSAASAIAPRRPFNELGLDSLMAVELRNAVGAALGRPQPATLLFDHPTTDTLVDHLLGLVETSAGPTVDPGATADPDAGAPAADTDDIDDIDVAALTEQEAEALLLAELGGSESSS